MSRGDPGPPFFTGGLFGFSCVCWGVGRPSEVGPGLREPGRVAGRNQGLTVWQACPSQLGPRL